MRKLRRLGIPTAADRTDPAAVKLGLEPIFEADFLPGRDGFRPRRRAQDAIAAIHHLGTPTRDYGWIFEADSAAGFDEIDHGALMDRVRRRVGDKRGLALLRAFLRAGRLAADGTQRQTLTGPPRRHPLAVAGEHGPVRARPAFSGEVGGPRPTGPSWRPQPARHRR